MFIHYRVLSSFYRKMVVRCTPLRRSTSSESISAFSHPCYPIPPATLSHPFQLLRFGTSAQHSVGAAVSTRSASVVLSPCSNGGASITPCHDRFDLNLRSLALTAAKSQLIVLGAGKQSDMPSMNMRRSSSSTWTSLRSHKFHSIALA